MSNKEKYIKNVDIKKENDKISVTLAVMHFDHHKCREKVVFDLSDVSRLLRERNVKVGSCIQNAVLQNKRKTSATWVFENPNKKVTPRQQPTRRSSKRKNSEKTQKRLDNIEKDVIIKETITEE
jgi:hypothetical protein